MPLCIMGTLLLSMVTGMSLSLKLRGGKKKKKENGLKVPLFLSKHCLKLQANALLQMLK